MARYAMPPSCVTSCIGWRGRRPSSTRPTSIRCPIATCCCGSRTTSASGLPSARTGRARRVRWSACWRCRPTSRSCCSRRARSMPGSTTGALPSAPSSDSSPPSVTRATMSCAAGRRHGCRNCAGGLTDCRLAEIDRMKLKVAIQMDHVSTIDIDGDSTFVLGLEAERRSYELWHYTPKDLVFRDRKVMARAQPMKLRREKGNHFTLGPPETLDLARTDVVLLRQDPPFDMSYITTTHLLEHIHPATLVVNDPASVRNAPEKLFVTHFDNVMPPTLISADPRALRDFRDEHKDII